MQQEKRGQTLLTVERREMSVWEGLGAAVDEVEIQRGEVRVRGAFQRVAQHLEEVLANLGFLCTLATLGVVALQARDADAHVLGQERLKGDREQRRVHLAGSSPMKKPVNVLRMALW